MRTPFGVFDQQGNPAHDLPILEPDFLRWKQPVLRSGETIRQEPREERIGNTVERGDAAGGHRNATRRAGVFCAVGSSKGLPVFLIRAAPFSCPRHKISPAQAIPPQKIRLHYLFWRL